MTDYYVSRGFDLGIRYSSSVFQGSFGGFYNSFKNRIVTSFDPALGISLDRNVGRVQGYGVDAGFAWRPVPVLTLFGNASYNHSELKDNIQVGGTAVGMSTVPETILARRFGLKVAGLSVITNLAAGIEGASPSQNGMPP